MLFQIYFNRLSYKHPYYMNDQHIHMNVQPRPLTLLTVLH